MKISGSFLFQVRLKTEEERKICKEVMNHIKKSINRSLKELQTDKVYVKEGGKVLNREIFMVLMRYYKKWEIQKESEYKEAIENIAERMEEKKPKQEALKPKSEPGAHNI